LGKKINKLSAMPVSFGNYSFEIVKKKIKHIYFRVYPAKEKIVVSAPVHLDSETLHKAILSKSAWLNKQISKGKNIKPITVKTVTTGEKVLFKESIGRHIARWQPVMGVKVNEYGVRKMKTRWGSCNINAGRIWLNFALIKLTDPFLEYVIVHEMVHLLERKHNTRFKGFMDQFIPDWRKLKKELDLFSL